MCSCSRPRKAGMSVTRSLWPCVSIEQPHWMPSTYVGALAIKAAFAAVWLLACVVALHQRTVSPKLAICEVI